MTMIMTMTMTKGITMTMGMAMTMAQLGTPPLVPLIPLVLLTAKFEFNQRNQLLASAILVQISDQRKKKKLAAKQVPLNAGTDWYNTQSTGSSKVQFSKKVMYTY